MRAIFLFLLLANLLVLAWSRWIAAPPVPTRAAGQSEPSPFRPIRLQREALRAGTPTGGVDIAAAATCVSMGPFAREAQANAAANALRRLGFTSRLRAAQDDVRIGYWVRVTDLATPADATNALVALKAVGLEDVYVIPDDDAPGNAVSIGVFADPNRAAAATDLARRAGFTPVTSDRVRTLDVFWLDFDRQANGGIPAVEDLEPPAGDALPIELRVCPSAPVEPGSKARPGGPGG